jgi:hypothetical protein
MNFEDTGIEWGLVKERETGLWRLAMAAKVNKKQLHWLSYRAYTRQSEAEAALQMMARLWDAEESELHPPL